MAFFEERVPLRAPGSRKRCGYGFDLLENRSAESHLLGSVAIESGTDACVGGGINRHDDVPMVSTTGDGTRGSAIFTGLPVVS